MKKRHGGLSFPINMVIFIILMVAGLVISILWKMTVVQTRADIEMISQGDTALFSMLETSYCAPATGAPLKYAIGVGLAAGGADPVAINFGGVEEKNGINIKECARRFLKSINASEYSFTVNYGGAKYYSEISSGYKDEERKKTEKVFISVPSANAGIAEVVLSTNIPPRGDELCPEKAGTHFCTPKAYCLLSGSKCDQKSDQKGYLCGGAACCCIRSLAW